MTVGGDKPPFGSFADWRTMTFEPQSDITAYELAIIVKNFGGPHANLRKLHMPTDALRRHFSDKQWAEMKSVERHFKPFPVAPMNVN